MRVALVTSVYGDYDPLRPLPDWHGFDDAVVVTDDQSLFGKGWRVLVEKSLDPPRLAAKRAKMMPWIFTDCDAAVWLDASFEIISPEFSSWARKHLEFNDFVAWLHPEGRVDIRDEVDICADFPKYRDYRLRDQVEMYFRDGFPEKWGLLAAGTLGWVFTEDAKCLGVNWLDHCRRYSIQDQLSLPYLLWDQGKRYGIWQANEYANPYVQLRWDERPRPSE